MNIYIVYRTYCNGKFEGSAKRVNAASSLHALEMVEGSYHAELVGKAK